jgi:hypothetical protein
MIKGLKVVMIIGAAVWILLGLALVFTPGQLGAMMGFAKGPDWSPYIHALLGVCYIAGGAFIIVAAARDPLKHIMWVQFAIVVTVLALAVELYSIMRGFVTFEQVGTVIIVNAVFFVALMALYPWRAKLSSG